MHASHGGSWGEIARPLQAPYDKLSTMVFELGENQASEPVETENGWYIVRCGKITPGTQASFTDVQDEIRQRLTEQKFERLSTRYMVELAGNATVSSMESFVRAAIRRVLDQEWEEPANP